MTICKFFCTNLRIIWISQEGHSKDFYLFLKRLLLKYDCLTEEYKQREYRYRRVSLQYL
jgi:hypothetical protein